MTRRLLALAALACAAPALAQQHPNLERGVPMDKAFSVGDIDAVSLYNGSLSLSIPLGQTYTVGGSLSYAFRLTYTSSLWDYGIDTWEWCQPPYNQMNVTTAEPVDTNAGFGWNLSFGYGAVKVTGLGRITDPFVYTSPDGSQHTFYPTLHPEETPSGDVMFSRDGTYLRLKFGSIVACGGYNSYTHATVETPDGTIQTFDGPGCGVFSLSRVDDAFGNYLTVTYGGGGAITYQDSQGRSHVWQNNQLKLDAFDDPGTAPGDQATYTFTYLDGTVAKSCKHKTTSDPCWWDVLPAETTESFLSRITLPDGSTWVMADLAAQPPTLAPYYNMDRRTAGNDACAVCDYPKDKPGTLKKIKLPTGGSYEWTYTKWENPVGSTGCYESTDDYGLVNESTGVYTKTLKDAAGASAGQWTYAHDSWRISGPDGCDSNPDPDQVIDPDSQESWTIVTNPEGDDTKSYFRTRYCLSSPPAEGWDFALPFTKGRTGTDSSPYKSVEYYDGSVASGTLKRTTYLTYDHDTLVGGGTPPSDELAWHNSNRRVNFAKTVFNDDASHYATTTYTSFDGLSHYRVQATGGDFPGTNSRTTTTNYNPSAGTYPGSFTLPSTTGPWLLGTYDYQQQDENGVSAKQEYCFESSTGYLSRSRTLKSGTTRNAADLVSVFTRDSTGNTTREEHFGGDTQAVSTAAGTLCNMTLPSCGTYRLDHTYQYGVRNTTRYVDTTTCPGTAMSSYSLDLDIDQSTGLPAATRDSAGIQTSFVFDAMGRLAWEKPQSGHGAYLHNQFLAYGTCGGPAKVESCTKSNGTTTECVNVSQSCAALSDSLTRSAMHFDFLGRLSGEFTKYTSSLWNQRLTTYNALGWKTSVSEWQPNGTSGGSLRKTDYSGFDPFGRATVITPPDGSAHNITMSYTGTRLASRTVKVATSVGAESSATTTEEYDRLGRLAKVTESSGYNDAAVDTTYAYDVGNRLKQVTTTAWVPELSQNVTQNRYLTYDNRGFLTAEQLPELGATGNGTITYSSYDARGHALRRYDGLTYVKFEYDKAERLTKVRESNSSWGDVRILRQFDYATANNGSDKRNGKLLTATANNVISTTTFPVVETYTYAGVGGRVSRRQTSVDSRTINLDLTWTDLGKLASVTYPDDTGISDPARTVSPTYSWGLLTAVPSYATSISYHPNLMINQVVHGNGVTDTYARDDNDLRRPKSIATSGAATNWLSGTYGFDGAGNVKAIGSDTYTYDLVSRLKEGTTIGGTVRQCASYNAFGTIKGLGTGTSSCTPSAISVDHASNRMASPVTYTAAGDMTAWGGFAYTWDKLDQMADVSGTGMTKRTYLYTADGERIEERVGPDALNPTSITISARGLDAKVLRLFTKSSGTWSWTKDYVYRDGQHLASVESTGTKHFHLDHLGSVRRITGTGTPAAVLASHDFYPFGLEATSASQDTERMKLTGHERDLQGTTGQSDDLYYMHARYYNPNIARFLSVDPGRDVDPKVPQAWNMYAYLRNNPVNLTDPDGRLVQFSDAFIKRLREDKVFRQAFKLWRSTDTGRKQWGKMRDDQNTLYKLNVGVARNNEGVEKSGNTDQTPRAGQKHDQPSDAQEVRMTINADYSERQFLVGRGATFTSREIADTLGHEAIHGLGYGAGELTLGQVTNQALRMHFSTDPELERFRLELQLLSPDSE